MKKIKVFCMMLFAALTLVSVSSCSKDKDDHARTIAGSYKGQLYMANAPIATDVIITVTRNGDNQVTLKLNQELPGFGAFNISCESGVAYTGQSYGVAGNTTFNMETGVAGMTIPVPVALSGTIDKSGNMDVLIHVEVPAAPVGVDFKGKKQ
ncbi:MAG: calycin-like domain-containing protein [Tannerella sp.]|jgi:hypothetical protein|nr:calycin-like domain-containing protein [Tannerella sp.]